jgi:DNA-binding MarR family transcriptional regulator
MSEQSADAKAASDKKPGSPDDKKDKKKKAAAPITAESFAELAAEMSKFLGTFAAYKPLQDENLGFAEWIVLCELKKGPMQRKKIAKTLGADVARVDQLTSTLQKAGYIDRPKDDNKSIELTVQGQTRLTGVNSKLTPLFAKAMDGRDRAVSRGMKSLKTLVRGVSEPRGEGGEGKGKGKDKAGKAGKAGKDPEKKAKKKEAKDQRKAAKGQSKGAAGDKKA